MNQFGDEEPNFVRDLKGRLPMAGTLLRWVEDPLTEEGNGKPPKKFDITAG